MKSWAESFVLVFSFLITGCVSTLSAPSLPSPSTTEPIPSSEVRHTSGATTWRLTPTDQPQAYTSRFSTITVEDDVPVSRRDSLVIQATYLITTIRNSDKINFSGSITSLLLQGNNPDSAEIGVTNQILFTGKLNNHTINTRISDLSGMQDQSDCAYVTQTSLKIIHRNLFLIPLDLTAGQVWTDSISSSICVGDLPISSTVIRTLTAVGESDLNGLSVLVLDEKERTFSKGEGSQGQHHILMESQGITNGRFYIGRISGQLVMANTTNTTSVSVESSGRIQHFIQNSTEITQQIR